MLRRNEDPTDIVTPRHRRIFATIRVVEVSLAVLGMVVATFALSRPLSPGSTTRELYFLGWSTPGLFLVTAAVLFLVVANIGAIERCSRISELTQANELRVRIVNLHLNQRVKQRITLNIKAIAAAVVLMQGCATVHNGRHQEIPVVTDPAGAAVEVRCGEPQPVAVTPTTVRLPRRVDQCSLVLTRSGFRSETVVFESTVSGWVWGNFAAPAVGGVVGATRQSDQAFVDFLVGAAIGGAGFTVDALTGAMWQLEPAKVQRKLMPE